MVSVLRSFALGIGLSLFAAPLHALMLTVSGVTYEITLNLGSFTTVDTGPNGPLTTTPWFGSAFLHNALVDELKDRNNAASGPVVPDPNGVYLFANRSLSPGFITSSAYDPSLSQGTSDTFSFTTSDTRALTTTEAPLYYASGSAVVPSVPEINGNALAKALFCLFALGLWLFERRARVARERVL